MRAPIAPLFVPGDRPERFTKAAATAADAVIIDLEDAVDPSTKEAARANLLRHDIASKPVLARINGAGTSWWKEDLAMLDSAALSGVIVPKAERAGDLAEAAGSAGGKLAIIALIETVEGLDNIQAILSVPQVICVGFGSLDFGLDLGCEPSWEALLFTRSQLVLASRRAGKQAPIDGVTPTLDDPDLIAAEAYRARNMGFGGKLAIHPKQVLPILTAFRPTEKEITWAERVLAAATSDSAIKIDGQMIDKPLVERARRLMEAAAIPTEG